MSAQITLERRDRVAVVTIDRPDKMNSLDFAANDELIQIWERIRDDDDIYVALITGSGQQSFCAGADLKTYTMAYATTAAPEFRARFTDGPGFGGITRNLQVNKPLLAAINGYAISGGLELALACDIRFCAKHAEFALQDVGWGFHACDGGLIRLKEIVGLGNAMEIILSGDRIDADQALRIGLVNRVFDADLLMEESLKYAAHLATRAPLAQQLAKDVMKRAHGLSLDEALKLESMSFHNLGGTADLDEGTSAFREKRPAKFSGK
ncbi:MAG: enoyl-CoA hydratase/isomerase family protein [Gammaproteobacteria bacterium]